MLLCLTSTNRRFQADGSPPIPGWSIYPCPNRGDGWQASCEAISPTTPCQATAERSEHSELRRPGTGSSRYDAEASAIVWTGIECTALRLDCCRRSASCIPTLTCASTPGPEAGAQCGSAARWDLCGGLAVTGLVRPRPVPTATRKGRSLPQSVRNTISSRSSPRNGRRSEAGWSGAWAASPGMSSPSTRPSTWRSTARTNQNVRGMFTSCRPRVVSWSSPRRRWW